MKKISMCTVCMNRLYHLSQTLPRNISQNLDYPNIEFVVLNYNSKDEMDEWIMREMKAHIDSGVLKYYKTDEPEYFDRSHSKNMALRLATGDILCMVDADNYAGPGYASWISSVFAANGDDTIITTIRKDIIPYRDQGGKLGFSRGLFYAVHGFDESLIGYGVDDVDLVSRLERAGGRRVFIKDEKFLEFIDHSTTERLENHHMAKNLENVYIRDLEIGKKANMVLYMQKDGSFVETSYEFDERMQNEWIITFGGWSMRADSRKEGTFIEDLSGLTLNFKEGSTASFIKDTGGMWRSSDGRYDIYWKKVDKDNGEDELYRYLLLGYSECLNRLIYQQNEKQHYAVNKEGWGRGAVLRLS